MNCAIHTEMPATAFCRTCGKALCANCQRDVMGAIYCEPCIAARLQSGGPTAPSVVPITSVEGAPSPALATLLGFLPGVGAMYNGQFIKAFVHVAIFILLIVATNELSGFIGILIGFFVVYMAFEAHQTAKAKAVGQPSPDPLGLEQLFGIHETQSHPNRPVSSDATSAQTSTRSGSQNHPPTSAIVLIALGVIFLFAHSFEINPDKIWPAFLIVLGLWIAYKRTSGRA